ncbi:zinc metalloproteinase nas-6-like [Ischnura elegans]|uniref:zinc metalloproteinase nas-6-like n=1 Tax=Ischnura elegans TaxID=197161 RepID=UPI001ED87CA8|nr:zinc metalloproteinase nas-6-like [Ischnura elegans]
MLRGSALIAVFLLQPFLFQHGGKVFGIPVSWVRAFPDGIPREKIGTFQSIAEEGNFHEGDIILHKGLNGDTKNLVADRSLLWPGGILYYQLSNEFSEPEKNWIRTAIADLQSVTCVRFVESTGAGAYMLVRNMNGCAAPVGYYGIKTDMFLSSSGCRSIGTIQHEFLHTLGFWHEHTRPDRDSHVQIMWENIRPGRTANFLARSPQESQVEGMPYDYGSVMHYRAIAFSRDGSPTIVPLQPGAQIGQRVRYSPIDLAKLNRLYGCGAEYYQGKGLYEGGDGIEKEAEAEVEKIVDKEEVEKFIKEEQKKGESEVEKKEEKVAENMEGKEKAENMEMKLMVKDGHKNVEEIEKKEEYLVEKMEVKGIQENKEVDHVSEEHKKMEVEKKEDKEMEKVEGTEEEDKGDVKHETKKEGDSEEEVDREDEENNEQERKESEEEKEEEYQRREEEKDEHEEDEGDVE